MHLSDALSLLFQGELRVKVVQRSQGSSTASIDISLKLDSILLKASVVNKGSDLSLLLFSL